jgi:protein SCO1/2
MSGLAPAPADARRRSSWPWLIFGALIISALAIRVWTSGNRPTLPVIANVPAFDLVDQTGHPYGSEDLANKVWLASFIYTTCPGPCPRVMERMAHVQAQLGNEADLMLVSFSVDPQADTPDVLDAYARLRTIDPQRWRLLTGPVDDVVSLIRKGFMLALQRSDVPNAGRLATEGPVIHSTRLVLVDRDGRIRGYYETNDAGDMERLIGDTRYLLRNKAL